MAGIGFAYRKRVVLVFRVQSQRIALVSNEIESLLKIAIISYMLKFLKKQLTVSQEVRLDHIRTGLGQRDRVIQGM